MRKIATIGILAGLATVAMLSSRPVPHELSIGEGSITITNCTLLYDGAGATVRTLGLSDLHRVHHLKIPLRLETIKSLAGTFANECQHYNLYEGGNLQIELVPHDEPSDYIPVFFAASAASAAETPPSVADGKTVTEPDSSPLPTPVPTTVVEPCGPDGMPTDPSKPCLLLVNPLQALTTRQGQLEQAQKNLVQQLQQVIPQIQADIATLKGAKPVVKEKKP